MISGLLLSAGLFVTASADEPFVGCDTSFLSQPRTFAFDYSSQIQPIWLAYCANCHVAHSGNPQAGLDLDPPWSFETLQFNFSEHAPGWRLVDPGQAWSSLLFLKLACAEPPEGTGQRMPYARPPLPDDVLALIYDWIESGAPYAAPDRVFSATFESSDR